MVFYLLQRCRQNPPPSLHTHKKISKIENSATMVNNLKPLTIAAKFSILDVCRRPGYAYIMESTTSTAIHQSKLPFESEIYNYYFNKLNHCKYYNCGKYYQQPPYLSKVAWFSSAKGQPTLTCNLDWSMNIRLVVMIKLKLLIPVRLCQH